MQTEQQSNFRVYAQNFLITWSQTENWNKTDLFNWLKNIQGVISVVLGEEKHQDGGQHFHAFVKFEKRKNIQSHKFFNYNNHQANFKASKYPREAIKYCCKHDTEALRHGVDEKDFSNLLEMAKTLSELEFIEYCVKNKIPGYYHRQITEMVSRTCTTITGTEPQEQGKLNHYLSLLQLPENAKKSIVLIGPSGCGKTSWAKMHAPKPALFCTHMDDLRDFQPNYHKCIIFDDMDFQHIPRTAQIHIVDFDNPRSIHCRYSTARIPAKTLKIFTANNRPFSVDEAIDRRIQIIKC